MQRVNSTLLTCYMYYKGVLSTSSYAILEGRVLQQQIHKLSHGETDSMSTAQCHHKFQYTTEIAQHLETENSNGGVAHPAGLRLGLLPCSCSRVSR